MDVDYISIKLFKKQNKTKQNLMSSAKVSVEDMIYVVICLWPGRTSLNVTSLKPCAKT